ncbi:MAG: hypothetical protein HY805_03845 [Nitrospirae bacterium]|nr:hypothetical protein [Nitrospirota bacterium]
MNKLAQAIILQSVEDMWDKQHRAECMEFFTGEGFHICAQMAGLLPNEKSKLLNLAWKVLMLTNSQDESAGKRNAEQTDRTPALTF